MRKYYDDFNEEYERGFRDGRRESLRESSNSSKLDSLLSRINDIKTSGTGDYIKDYNLKIVYDDSSFSKEVDSFLNKKLRNSDLNYRIGSSGNIYLISEDKSVYVNLDNYINIGEFGFYCGYVAEARIGKKSYNDKINDIVKKANRDFVFNKRVF